MKKKYRCFGRSLIATSALLFSVSASADVTIAAAANTCTLDSTGSSLLSSLIADFKTSPQYPSGSTYNVTVTLCSSTGSVKNPPPTSGIVGAIYNELTADLGGSLYDLFFAADTAAPAYLNTQFPKNANGLGVYPPVNYAKGILTLVSNDNNISTGIPVTSKALVNNTVIANPSNAPYGNAASQVLLGLGVAANDPKLFQQPDIGLTYDSLVAGTYPMGFIAKSQICKGLPSPLVASFDYTSGYTPITQAYVRIGRTNGVAAQVNAFVTYLATARAKAVITGYCYTAL